MNTPDEDFLDLDLLKGGFSRLVILCHGLEGSSASKYILATSALMHSQSWDVVAVNYRGCSGQINNQVRMYHSGATDDLSLIVDRYIKTYDEIHLVGFSLGGNLVLKYCGEEDRSDKIKSVVAVSVPTNLRAGALKLNDASNVIYTKKFLQTLKEKIKKKHEQFPTKYQIENLNAINTVYDFDDAYTGPVHGFTGADDYYKQSSSDQFIPMINIPGLIINALDDPFLPEEQYPYKKVEANPNMRMLTPKYGGHLGFVNLKQKFYWNEESASAFLNKNSETH